MDKILRYVITKMGGKGGVFSLLKKTDPEVKLKAMEIANILDGMGVKLSDIKSPKEVGQFLNINKSAVDEAIRYAQQIHRQRVDKTGEVIQFPKDKITDWTKPRPTTGKKADVTELDDPLVNELVESPHGYGAGHGTADSIQATRIKQGFSTQSKLNSWSQNQKWVSDFVGRKNAEFNFLNKDDQKSVLEMFETQIKKHMPKEPKADGGVAGLLG